MTIMTIINATLKNIAWFADNYDDALRYDYLWDGDRCRVEVKMKGETGTGIIKLMITIYEGKKVTGIIWGEEAVYAFLKNCL